MPTEIRAFTGMRGVAALYVAIYHFGLYSIFTGRTKTVLQHGYIAVDLFFIMSGFVMALSYRDLFSGGEYGRNMWVFMGKRIARIYPLYLLASVAALCVVIWRGWGSGADELVPAKIVSNLLLVQSWGIAGSYIGPGWSISAEWAAYLVFPLLCFVRLFRDREVALFCASLAFASLILLAELPADVTHVVRAQGPLDLYDGQNYGAVARCLPEFTLGMVCFRVAQNERFMRHAARNWVSLLLVLLIGGLLSVGNSDILIVPLMALLLVSLANDSSRVARLLGSPVFYWLGTISYSVYLVHTTTAAVVEPSIQRAVAASGVPDAPGIEVLCLVLVVLAVATLTYSLIEKPGRRLLQRLFASRARQSRSQLARSPASA